MRRLRMAAKRGLKHMNEKEVAEIRRRFRPDKSNITHIRGCYVNDKREIVSEFDQSLTLMPQEEGEKMLTLLKRSLSGTLGKNLVDITFATQQVVDSEEHRRLMHLRDSALNDQEGVEAFYRCVIDNLRLEEHYLILLAYDRYDVPYRSKDGGSLEDASTEVFSYVLCAVCPVKMPKPALCYDVPQNAFHSMKIDWLVAPPELGFLFPAFDDRSTNIYNALYYTKSLEENHKEFVDAVFHTEIPEPAQVQKESFHTVIQEALEEECSFEVVETVHDELCSMLEEHKASKEPEPLAISKRVVKGVLESCGVSPERLEAFSEKYDERFGADNDIRPRNVVNQKQFEVKTPDVTIHVNPERKDLVETRNIDGTNYILIRAEGGVEVNGIDIHIS